MRATIATLPFAFFLMTSGACAQSGGENDRVAVLNVSGQGQVEVIPDRATVRFGVAEIAQTAALAQQSVNRVMNSIMNELKEQGIEERQIKTERLQLYPIQEMGERNRKPQITGYRASNSLSVTLDEIDRVGPVLDAATRVGSNEIQGIDFSLKDESQARSEALRQAVAEAREKATVMAEALGVKLLAVLEASESVGGGIPIAYRAARVQAAEAFDATPVSAGQVTVTASVNIQYRIGP